MPDPSREAYERVRRAFDRIVEHPAERWDDLLARHCGADSDLRQDVESLLAAHRAAVDPLVGRTIAQFRIDRLLARGGMARVYAATQLGPRREVAVKIMSPLFDVAAAQRRLANEAETLARLEHPGIARIYSFGTTSVHGDEIAYFAMELVRGAQSILDYATAHGLTIDQLREPVHA